MFEIKETEIIYVAIFYTVISFALFFLFKRSTVQIEQSESVMVQIKHRMVSMFLLFVFSIFVLVSGGFLSHQDTAWHQLA